MCLSVYIRECKCAFMLCYGIMDGFHHGTGWGRVQSVDVLSSALGLIEQLGP